METYVTVSFWLGLFAMFVRGAIMSSSKYPRVEEKTIGSDSFSVIIQAGFLIWAAALLWIIK